MSNQSALKARVYAFYNLHRVKGKLFTWQHFQLEGQPKTTIYRMIKQAEKNKPLNRKKGSGRTPKFNTPANRARLRKLFDHRRGVSLRKQARKWKCSPSTIANMLKSMKQAINCYKRKKRPDRTPLQRL
jgi:hypothetical protein